MTIQYHSLLKFYLLLAIGLYLGLIGFAGRLFGIGIEKGNLDAASAGNPFIQVAALTLLLMSGFMVLTNSKVTLQLFIRQGWVWGLLILFFAVSITWSATPFVSLRRVVAFSTLILVAFILVNFFTAKSLLGLIANTIVLLVVIGFIYQILSGHSVSFGLGERESGLRGIFTDKNGAARTYAYGLVLFVGLNKYKTKLDVLCVLILVLALMASHSASAIILAVLGCGIIFTFKFFRGKNKHQSFMRLGIIMAAAVLGTMLVASLYQHILSAMGRDANLTNRAIIWELITPYIYEKPILGYGFGSFWASDYVAPFVERWSFIGNSHSGYFEMMLAGGMIGFCILIVLLVLFLKWALSNYLARKTNQNVDELVLAICVVQIVMNYIGFVILNHNSVDMFVFVVAFFICVARVQKT